MIEVDGEINYVEDVEDGSSPDYIMTFKYNGVSFKLHSGQFYSCDWKEGPADVATELFELAKCSPGDTLINVFCGDDSFNFAII